MAQIDLRALYQELLEVHGPHGWWWPMQSRLEQAVGSVLVQQNKWEKAQLSIESLRTAGLLAPANLAAASPADVAELIRPSGLVKAKSAALPVLASWFVENEQAAVQWGDAELYSSLRSLPLVGPETADVISMYSYSRPRFIADAYARRLLSQRGISGLTSYEKAARALRPAWEQAEFDVEAAAELHGLVVEHGKRGHLRAEERAS